VLCRHRVVRAGVRYCSHEGTGDVDLKASGTEFIATFRLVFGACGSAVGGSLPERRHRSRSVAQFPTYEHHRQPLVSRTAYPCSGQRKSMKRGAAIASRGALAPHSRCVPPPRTPSPPLRAPSSPASTLGPSDRYVEMSFDAAHRERGKCHDLALRLRRELAHPPPRWIRTRRSPRAPSQLPRASTPGGDATSPTDRRWVALRRPGRGPCTSVSIPRGRALCPGFLKPLPNDTGKTASINLREGCHARPSLSPRRGEDIHTKAGVRNQPMSREIVRGGDRPGSRVLRDPCSRASSPIMLSRNGNSRAP
jgi:hypothetical protein